MPPLRDSLLFSPSYPGLASWTNTFHRSAAAVSWHAWFSRTLKPGDAKPAEHSAQSRLHLAVDLAGSFVDCREDEVLQHLNIAGFHSLRVDTETEKLFAAVHLHRDRTASGGHFNHSFLHPFLQSIGLRLGFGHQVLQIESAHRTSGLKVSMFPSKNRVVPTLKP